MKIEDIINLENNRKTKEQYGVLHLLKEGTFYHAYDWSAWLMTMFPMSDSVPTPTVKKLKDGYMNVFVGFPVSSLGKYIPDGDEVQFTAITDTQLDVTVKLTDDVKESDFDTIRSQVDDWKAGLPINRGNKQRREEREVAEAAPRITRISDILGRVLSFPLENKSPMEAYEFLRELRQQVAAMF